MKTPLIITLVVMLLLVISGCRGTTTASRQNVAATNRAPSVSCSASPSIQEVVSSAPAEVEVTVKNLGGDVVLTGETDWSVAPWYIDATFNGNKIGLSEQGKALTRDHSIASWQISGLNTGESMKDTLPVSTLFDLSGAGRYEFTFSRKYWRRGDSVHGSIICFAHAQIVVR